MSHFTKRVLIQITVLMIVFFMVLVVSYNHLSADEPESGVVEQTEAPKKIKIQRSRNPVKVKEVPRLLYTKEEKSLITLDGKCYGTLRFNGSQLLGIWDWYNATAVNAGIRSSYTLNWTIDMQMLLKNVDMSKMSLEAEIVDRSGKVIGNPCMVGWSGFPQSVDLFSKGVTSGDVEIGIQPITKKIPGDSCIKIVVKDNSNNMQFDPIYYDLSILSSAEKGAQLHLVDEEAIINSINGAQYSILFTRVEDNVRDTDFGTRDVHLYDVNYTIRYKSAPTNDRIVSIFDNFDDNKISPRLAFGIQSDADSTLLTDDVPTTVELTDKNNTFRYVTTTQSFGVGHNYKYKTNRKITDDVLPAIDYVRILVEFPEERAARNSKEMREFDGRYLVYQLKLSEYETPIDSEVFGGVE